MTSRIKAVPEAINSAQEMGRAVSQPARRTRDIRLDLFRGLAMLIIVIAHIPVNPWNDWIPARFGFSSAAEMFVFGSGFASALAFGRIFTQGGLWLGTMRIAHRIWQLYWAQIAPFLIVLAISAWATMALGTANYLEQLSLGWFLENPAEGIAALMTLRYIPQYFDMLPMYMLVLASLPLVTLLARLHRLAPLAAALSLWIIIQITGFNLSARPSSDWVWYFNPLAWQVLFILGYSFGMGWLAPVPLRRAGLVFVALVIVVGSIPFAFWGFTTHFEWLATIAPALGHDGGPTSLHPLRLLHFLALAYLVLSLIEPLRPSLAEISWLKPIEKVGQQTLAAFLASLPIAWSVGIALDWFGRSLASITLANLLALVAIVALAYLVAWFKSQPWKASLGQGVAHRSRSLPQAAE
jgi:hypothetical protein